MDSRLDLCSCVKFRGVWSWGLGGVLEGDSVLFKEKIEGWRKEYKLGISGCEEKRLFERIHKALLHILARCVDFCSIEMMNKREALAEAL